MPAARRLSQASTSSSGSKSHRAKTGCYTCRIRRKKCDGNITHDELGNQTCTTCQRLRVECLQGFGEKRGKQLKSRELIAKLRDLIKHHLNVNGLVKGIPRPKNYENGSEPILNLSQYLISGDMPFPLEPGSPSATGSDSSSESCEDLSLEFWDLVLHVQHGPAELENDGSTIPNSLDQWCIYQMAQEQYFLANPMFDDVTGQPF